MIIRRKPFFDLLFSISRHFTANWDERENRHQRMIKNQAQGERWHFMDDKGFISIVVNLSSIRKSLF